MIDRLISFPHLNDCRLVSAHLYLAPSPCSRLGGAPSALSGGTAARRRRLSPARAMSAATEAAAVSQSPRPSVSGSPLPPSLSQFSLESALEVEGGGLCALSPVCLYTANPSLPHLGTAAHRPRHRQRCRCCRRRSNAASSTTALLPVLSC